MRDHDRGPIPHEPLQGVLHQCLGLRVQRARRLVQDEDARIGEHGSCDGEALSLPARQLHAPLPNHRVVSVRKGDDEVMCVRGPCRGDQIAVGGSRSADLEVLCDGSGEQQHLLGNGGHLASQGAKGLHANIDAVDKNLSGGHVVKAWDQLCERRLSCSRRPDQGDGLPGRDDEVDGGEHLDVAARVRERHPIEQHRALADGGSHGRRLPWHFDRLVEQLEYPQRRSEGLLKLGVQAGEGADRSGNDQRIEQERHEFTRGQVTVDHEPSSNPQHHCQRSERDEGDERHEEGPQPRPAQRDRVRAEYRAVVSRNDVVLCREPLYDADRCDRLVGQGVGLGDLVLKRGGDTPYAPTKNRGSDNHRGKERKHGEREHRADHHEQDHTTDEGDPLGQGLCGRRRHRALYDDRVRGEPGGDLPGAATIEEWNGETNDPVVDGPAQIGHDTLADNGQRIDAHVVEDTLDEEDGEQHQRDPIERARAAVLGECAIDQATHDPWEDQAEGCRNDNTNDGDGQPSSVRPQEGE